MAQDIKTLTYGEGDHTNTYTLKLWSPQRSFKMQVKLLKSFGPTIAALFDDKSSKGDAMKGAMESLVEHLDDSSWQMLMDCLEGVTFNGSQELKPQVESHFYGRNEDLYRLVFDQLKFQYEKVFKGVGAKLAHFAPAIKSL